MNHEETKASLLNLLAANRSMPGAEVCIAELKKETVDLIHVFRHGSIQVARHTATVRAKIAREHNRPIVGLQELAINLENTDRLFVNSYRIKTANEHLLIYTDDDIETLFGINVLQLNQ